MVNRNVNKRATSWSSFILILFIVLLTCLQTADVCGQEMNELEKRLHNDWAYLKFYEEENKKIPPPKTNETAWCSLEIQLQKIGRISMLISLQINAISVAASVDKPLHKCWCGSGRMF
jgi:hypothetical protein